VSERKSGELQELGIRLELVSCELSSLASYE
jgi:hypothetical protein